MSLGEETVVGSLGIKEVGRLASLEDSLFEGLLALLERLKGDMMGRLLEWTMREISEKARAYSQERCKANVRQYWNAPTSITANKTVLFNKKIF